MLRDSHTQTQTLGHAHKQIQSKPNGTERNLELRIFEMEPRTI